MQIIVYATGTLSLNATERASSPQGSALSSYSDAKLLCARHGEKAYPRLRSTDTPENQTRYLMFRYFSGTFISVVFWYPRPNM